MEIGTRDVESPVVMSRRGTPANRPLQHLEAGHLGASKPQHVMSRPAVPDLCKQDLCKQESSVTDGPPGGAATVRR